MSTDVLTERYGVAPPWRRRALAAAAALVVLAFAGWLTWTTLDASDPEVTSQVEGWDPPGERVVTVTVLVELASPDVEASCRLRATAEDHQVVGELNFSPDPAAGTRQVLDIRTERRATAVESLGCTAPGQKRPR